MFSMRYALTCLFLLIGSTLSIGAEKKDEPAKLTFEQDVLPILKAKCHKCHSGAKAKAGLDLTTRRGVLRGGQSGAAVRRAAAESSLLWDRIAAGEMPPKGDSLTDKEKGLVRSWINDGALSESGEADSAGSEIAVYEIDDQARKFWSFQPPQKAALPEVNDVARVRTPIDTFVLKQLEENGLTLSPEASRATLIRRTHFDLLGLPPTPEDVQAFVSDKRVDSYDRLIDRLLAHPAYGERWGRHWLDVAGYTDSAGILFEDRALPLAYRYRDYVIRAFNKNKPYDRFLQEQIAGDELVDYWHHFDNDDSLSNEIVEAITATGYLRCAADPSRPDFSKIKNADSQYFYPTINDTMQIVSTSTMGVTLQCARCHDHMFDPIPQEDFYRIQSIFMGAYRPTNWIPQMERRLTSLSKSQEVVAKQRNKEIDAKIKELNGQISKLRQDFKARRFEVELAKLPEELRDGVREAIVTAADKRDETQRQYAVKYEALLQPDDKKLDELLPSEFPEYVESLGKLNEQIITERARWYAYDEIRAIYDLPGEVPTPFLRRGDALTPAHHVSPGALTVLNATVEFQWPRPAAEAKTSGRRLAFARWLTDPGHPLAARVMVNRIWLHHFGRGIVATPDDFGNAGSPPSHPKLLDWLAVEFVESGWSIKHVHRLIMTSSTYRQRADLKSETPISERKQTDPHSIDPDNRLLWRQRLRRLEAEALRDAVLHVAGSLNTQFFGPPVPTHRWATGEITVAKEADPYRRSVYIQNRRLYPLTMLRTFDQPTMETNCTLRSQSTVSTQALTLLNSGAMIKAADSFAGRVLAERDDNVAARAVWLAFGRPPGQDEVSFLQEFVEAQQQRYSKTLEEGSSLVERRRLAVADMCHMLLSANEFIYID